MAIIIISWIVRLAHPPIDTSSESYQGGYAYAQSYSEVGPVPADVDAFCVNLEFNLNGKGWGWQGGQLNAGQVNARNFNAGCEDGFKAAAGQ